MTVIDLVVHIHSAATASAAAKASSNPTFFQMYTKVIVEIYGNILLTTTSFCIHQLTVNLIGYWIGDNVFSVDNKFLCVKHII